jgi:hypothetical protein
MVEKTTDQRLVAALSAQWEGKPERCMAVSSKTGERCKNLARKFGSAYCGHHRATKKAAR